MFVASVAMSRRTARDSAVLTHVSKGMPAYDEEIFGPVAVCTE